MINPTLRYEAIDGRVTGNRRYTRQYLRGRRRPAVETGSSDAAGQAKANAITNATPKHSIVDRPDTRGRRSVTGLLSWSGKNWAFVCIALSKLRRIN